MDSTSKASLKQKLLAKGEVFGGYGPSDSICDWILLKEVRENLGFKSSIYQSSFGNININPIGDSLYFSQKKPWDNFQTSWSFGRSRVAVKNRVVLPKVCF